MQSQFTLGDTLSFSESFTDYPASAGWVLHYRLLPSGDEGQAVTFDAAASGDAFAVSVPAATTAAWTPGLYSYVAWVTSGADSYTVGQGRIQLKPNARTFVGSLDLRSQAEIALADAKAAFSAWTPTTRRYKINGREMEFSSTAEIIQVVSHWENEVRRERNAEGMAAGRPSNRKVQVRLGRA